MNKKDENNEFVPEYFAWVPMEKQRRIVEKLEKMTKNNKKRRK